VVDVTVLSAFVLASLVIILSPGADTFLLLRYAIRGGRSAGFQSMVGILLGLSLVSLVLISGVGLLITQFPLALDGLTFVGIGILLYLALTSIRAGSALLKNPPEHTQTPSSPSQPTLAIAHPLRMSLITNVTNPKVLIFYLGFFPQFLGEATSAVWQLTLLSVAFLVVTVVWLVPLVYVASAAKAFFQRPLVAVAMEFSVGAVFLALAIVLIVTL